MMNKRVKEEIKKFHNENYKIKFCLGTLSLVWLCLFILIIATFTQIKINFNIPDNGLHSYLKFEYIPQIPVILFIAGLLGETWGLITVLLYIIIGLIPYYPVFALGGGLSYIFQYNFGYIFSYIFAVIITGKQLNKSNNVLNIILSVIYGITLIHVIGIFYLTVIALLRHDSFEFIKNLIYYQSVSKILYDIVFGFIALLIAKGIRKVLWLLIG